MVCQVCVDTNKIVAGKTYQRTLVLHTNSPEATHTLDLEVTTAPLPRLSLPYQQLVIMIVLAIVGGFMAASVMHAITPIQQVPETFGDIMAMMSKFGQAPANVDPRIDQLDPNMPVSAAIPDHLMDRLQEIIRNENRKRLISAWGGLLLGLGSGIATGIFAASSDIYAMRNALGFAAIISIVLRFVPGFWANAMVGIIIGIFLGATVGYLGASSNKDHLKLGFPESFAFGVPTLAALFSLATGIAIKLSVAENYIQMPALPWLAAIAGIALVGLVGKHMLQQKTFLDNYRRRSKRLVKP
jgi:hypothetical protein